MYSLMNDLRKQKGSPNGTDPTEQIQVLPEYQEEYLKDLLPRHKTVAGEGQEIPKYEDFVAALTPEQLKAIEIGTQGIGAYQPMLEEGAPRP